MVAFHSVQFPWVCVIGHCGYQAVVGQLERSNYTLGTKGSTPPRGKVQGLARQAEDLP